MARTLTLEAREDLSALTEMGIYETADAVITDALRTLFAARPDLREAVACRLYEKGAFSLGRAAEWSGMSIEGMKSALGHRGIQRRSDEEPPVIDAMIERSARLSRRGVT